MRFLAFIFVCLVLPVSAQKQGEMVIVVSEPGNAEYETEFRRQADAWQEFATKAGMTVHAIGLAEKETEDDLLLLKKTLNAIAKEGEDLWLIWIGHGSFDGRTANFNLRGKDLEAKEFGKLLEPFERRLIVLNLFSASAPFLETITNENRIVVCSGRSSTQRNYSRFGEKFADALTDSEADMDFDDSLSLLEVFLHASDRTRAFYKEAQRVVQEHAVLDDNGDGVATPADQFKGLRTEYVAEGAPSADGLVARELFLLGSAVDSLTPEAKQARAKLEEAIDDLKKRKEQMPEEEYYRQLESLLREMAKVYGYESLPRE